jgi:hypothetical protein
MGKSFKTLIEKILSIFLISNTLQLVCLLILFFFIPLFFIILAVPLDDSWIKIVGKQENQTAIVYGILLPSKFLIYTSNSIKGISTFKDVFSSLVIPLITAYSLKSIETEQIPYKVRLFLTYLIILLFFSLIGNALVNAVDFNSIKQGLEEQSDTLSGNVSTEILEQFPDSLKILRETTSNYVKDCFTYIGLTLGITFKSH